MSVLSSLVSHFPFILPSYLHSPNYPMPVLLPALLETKQRTFPTPTLMPHILCIGMHYPTSPSRNHACLSTSIPSTSACLNASHDFNVFTPLSDLGCLLGLCSLLSTCLALPYIYIYIYIYTLAEKPAKGRLLCYGARRWWLGAVQLMTAHRRRRVEAGMVTPVRLT